jgi:hypothetical protein
MTEHIRRFGEYVIQMDHVAIEPFEFEMDLEKVTTMRMKVENRLT